MNPLISIGIKTESLTILRKYTSSCSHDDDLIKAILSKSLELNKQKILIFLLNKFDRNLLESIDNNQLTEINQKAKKNKELALVLDGISQLAPPTKTTTDDEDNIFSDWESDDDDITFKSNDAEILSAIADSDKQVSNITLSQEGEFWDDVSPELLPRISVLNQSFSKFVLKNKSSLQKFYNSNVDPQDRSKLLKNLFGDDFDDAELLLALEKINQDVEGFDNWLEELDSLLADSSNPKLSNPAYYGYFRDLAEDKCKPLSAEEENKLLRSIQAKCYEILFGMDENQRNRLLENINSEFNDELENPYLSIEPHFYKDSFILEQLKTVLATRDAFIKPLNFLTLFKNSGYRSPELQIIVEEINTLVSKFQQSNLRLVASQVKKYKVFYANDYLDLIQEGNLALLSAINKFEPNKGYKFSTYATWWIKQAVTRYIDSNTNTVRLPVHMAEKLKKVQFYFRNQGVELSPHNLKENEFRMISQKIDVSESELSSLHRMLIWEETVDNINDLQKYEPKTNDESEEFIEKLFHGETLKDKERMIITQRFGLNGNAARTLEEVGQEFGVTRERIRQIEAKALEKLEAKAGLLMDSAPNIYGGSHNE